MSDPELERETVDAVALRAADAAREFLAGLAHDPAMPGDADRAAQSFSFERLPEAGVGAAAAVDELAQGGLAAASRSAGPRFFHFVTGGATPAALAGDWLTSAFDQNSFTWASSPLGTRVESVACAWLKQLFALPDRWDGVLTTGATMANFTALAAARRWWAGEHGRDVDADGFAGLPELPVFSSGYLHASVVKALSMLGVGRNHIRRLAADPVGRLDLAALRTELERLGNRPALVIATAGEVNAGDFDPVAQVADLIDNRRAWLHVDGAFGLFARVSSLARDLGEGIERADSVIADGHKWLNVPYDCGFTFVAQPGLLRETFAATGAPYLPAATDARPNYSDRGPEMSRRARSLAVWATLRAYGRDGYRMMVDRHIELAQRVGAQVEADSELELLAPVQLNVVCFRYHPRGAQEATLDALNRRLASAVQADGRVYFGTTVYGGRVAFRPAVSNWRTTEADVDLITQVTKELGARVVRAVG